jgi:hypothetical protein
MDTLN